jgi:hypothetical protein
MPTPTAQQLGDKLKSAVEEIDGVEILPSPSGKYYTCKVDGHTIGYVNGSRKIRVDLPRRNGKREHLNVLTNADVTKAVKQMKAFAPKPEPES